MLAGRLAAAVKTALGIVIMGDGNIYGVSEVGVDAP